MDLLLSIQTTYYPYLSGTDSQELCEGIPITNIIYEFSGGANDANVSGLPAGVNAVVTSNNITISGTPTGPISTPTTFNYTVTTQGGNCTPASLLGTITVNPNDALALSSAVGTENQVLCDANSLNTIVYEFSGGATTATVSGLPVGVNAVVTSNQLIISGTPPAATGTTQVYPYTVTTSGACDDASLSGTITVDPNDELSLLSGTDSQELCEGNPITNIIYEFSGGADDANVSGLPAGVTAVVTS